MERNLSRIAAPFLIVFIFLLSACSNLFDGNWFENFDAPPSADDILDDYVDEDGTVSTEDADDFVNDLGEAADSDRFFDDLSDEDRDELGTALKSVYDNPDVDVVTRQEAAILAGEIAIRDTGAGDTVNNVVEVLLSSEGGADSFNDAGAFINAIIPSSAEGDPEAIRQILEYLVVAADAYDALGNLLTDTDGDGTPDGPEGSNMGEVAQNAAVAIILAATADLDGDGTVSDAELDALTTASVDDDFSAYNGTPLDDSLGSDASPTPLRNILDAGGLLEMFESDG